MEQRRVSFKVAKAIKDAGYPQDNVPITEIGWYNIARVYTKQLPTYWEGDHRFVAVAPTYLDVWLWLWREKKVCIGILFDEGNCGIEIWYKQIFLRDFEDTFDLEEAIIAAIEYLVNNDLIK